MKLTCVSRVNPQLFARRLIDRYINNMEKDKKEENGQTEG